MEARDLDRLVTIRRRVEASDGIGGATVTWSEVARVWANIRAMRGGERFLSIQIQAESTYVVTIRNRADVVESDVIDDETLGRFDIRFIKRTPRAPFLELECFREPITAASTGGSSS